MTRIDSVARKETAIPILLIVPKKKTKASLENLESWANLVNLVNHPTSLANLAKSYSTEVAGTHTQSANLKYLRQQLIWLFSCSLVSRD
jgi:hypothetical protein